MTEPDVVPSAYPARWEADVALDDGGTVHIRPVRPADVERVRAFHGRQSRESIYFRYFSPMPKLSARELERLTKVDYLTRMAFVALLGDEIVAMASYDIWRDVTEAEVAFIVDDAQQGRGIATLLLEYLIVSARENGLRALTAQVLPSNRRMLAVFHHAGFDVSSSFDEGLIEVRLGIEPTEQAAAAMDERARLAEARSVERLLFPESIAVIGAGRRPGGVGHEVFRNLVNHGFDGPVYPVNRAGGHVASVRAYASVLDIADEVDLAIVAVPAAAVLDVVEECARKRVRGMVIISADVEEYQIDGRSAAHVVVERALRSGIRVLGPESMGIVNTAPGASLVGTFADVRIGAGSVGFLTQSGTLGLAALEHAQRMGLGISTFVDIGQRADVSGNDLLQFWDGDDNTSVVALYLESFGNPRKFTRIARRLARNKPIVAVKSGRSRPEREAAEGTLGAVWPSDATVGALLSQSGVIRVDTPSDLFNVARVLVNQPVPKGRRVAVISNARGASVLTADACAGAGLELAVLGEHAVAQLRDGFPAGVKPANPVDLTWRAGPEHYERALGAVLADDGVDAVIVVYAPPIRERRAEVARAIGAATSIGAPKPILATFLASDVGMPLLSGASAVPLFEYPSEAARLLGRIADYADWLEQPVGSLPEVDPGDFDELRAWIMSILDDAPDGCWLDRDRAAELLSRAGVPVARHHLVTSVGEAVDAAAQLGHPVVLKATGVGRYHPGEEGGVALDLFDEAALRGAYERMCDALGPAMSVAVVQELVPAGADLFVAGYQDASFGAVVSLGIGGFMAAANPDLPVRIVPLSDTDAAGLVAASPVASLLEQEGADHAATRATEELLVRLGVVLEQVPEISDVVVNPLIVGAHGAKVVEAEVRVAPYRFDVVPAVRRL